MQLIIDVKNLYEEASKSMPIEDFDFLKQEKLLEKYARTVGIWYGDENTMKTWNFIGNGCESHVYECKDITKIIKVMNYNIYSSSPKQFLEERIVLYNQLFSETAYELIGFARFYDDFCFDLTQPFIEGDRLELEEIESEMNNRGFYGQYYKFINQQCMVEDLHQGNVLKDKSGNIFVIDAIPSFIVPNSQKDFDNFVFNDYYLQRQKDMQIAIKKMAKYPLSFEEKREQTQFILDSLYL